MTKEFSAIHGKNQKKMPRMAAPTHQLGRKDSNLRMPVSKTSALTAWLLPNAADVKINRKGISLQVRA